MKRRDIENVAKGCAALMLQNGQDLLLLLMLLFLMNLVHRFLPHSLNHSIIHWPPILPPYTNASDM